MKKSEIAFLTIILLFFAVSCRYENAANRILSEMEEILNQAEENRHTIILGQWEEMNTRI